MVSGAGSHFTLAGGEIKENYFDNGPWNRVAGAVLAQDGGVVDLTGGLIHENGMFNPDGSIIASTALNYKAGGALALAGGTINVTGTQMYWNVGQAGGGVIAYSVTAGKPALVNISDNAVIAANVSNAGGGVGIYGNATVHMTGGQMFNNEVSQGGGAVNAMDLCYSADNSGRRSDFLCASWGISPEQWEKDYPAAFIMDGGVIKNNKASTTGGGINVSSKNVTINAGSITDNSAKLQGGGIYVTTQPYDVQINNSLVTDNEASFVGGGVWVCPTGEAHFYINGGTAVYDNTASDAGSDVSGENYGGTFQGSITTEPRALGGGEVNWYQDNADARYTDGATPDAPTTYRWAVGLHTEFQNDALALATDIASVTISGNTAARGGGIGSNGTINFGTPGTNQLTLNKVWQYDNGEAMAEADIPESASFKLYEQFNGQEYYIQDFTATKADNWTVTLTDLPTQVQGQDPVFVVKETPVDGVTASLGELVRDADGNWLIEATNSIPAPTPTETPEPTPTETPESTPTDTPQPSPTDTPEPTTTDTPEPMPTDTVTPTPPQTPTDTPTVITPTPDTPMTPGLPTEEPTAAPSESTPSMPIPPNTPGDAPEGLAGTGADVMPLAVTAGLLCAIGLVLTRLRLRQEER